MPAASLAPRAELCLASATGFSAELETMAGLGEVTLIGPDVLFGS